MIASKQHTRQSLMLVFLAVTSLAAVFAAFIPNIENTGTQNQLPPHIGNHLTSVNHVTLPPLLTNRGRVDNSASPAHQTWTVPTNSTPEPRLRRLAHPFGDQEKHFTKSKRDTQGVCTQCWQDAICKGERLQLYMRSSIEDATRQMGGPSESRWTNYPTDLLNNQWRLEAPGNLVVTEAGIDTALQQLGLSADEPPNRILTWSHPPTRGSYKMIFNVKEGFLGFWSSYSPSYTRDFASQPLPPLPDLIQLSDISFLEWQNQQRLDPDGKPGTPPQWIGRVTIENEATLDLIDQTVLSLRGEGTSPDHSGLDIPAWPGIALGPDDDGFKALLSSPNGVAAAWFLIQHKEYFGLKEVVRMIVYENNDIGPNMFLELGDARPL